MRLLVALMALAVSGCVSFGIRTTGAASIDDLNAENAYVATYMDQMTRLHRDFQAFQPADGNPGVCNKGGSKQGCFDADAALINDLVAMSAVLKTATVPPRFVEADRLVKEAIGTNIQGLRLRNQAIAQNDQAAWDQHAPLLQQASESWKAAYAAFPPDHRPALAP